MSDNPIHQARATVNPYLSAGGLILSRLRWDLDYRSWVSRPRLRGMLNRHCGEKAVIICNGPSLLGTDWPMLDDVYTFGLNKINLLFDQTDFRPSSIVSVNPFVLEQNREFFGSTDIPLFLDSYATKAGIRLTDNVILMHRASIDRFARDCSVSVNWGGTVTYVALQLAYHMGFSDVALVGCDHSFSAIGSANEVARRVGTDQDHFHPDYFPAGQLWQLPDLDLSEASYKRANSVFQAFGRRIVNATDGGELEIFPRISLEEFICG
ncbi:MAG: 6-hydroxymethylpterin diphosphokinase MptE-like protein [Sedimenticola sp.]